MERKKLFIDVDNTLANTMQNWVEVARAEYGIKQKFEDFFDYDIKLVTGLPYELVTLLFKKVWSKNEEISIIDSAVPSIVKRLGERYSINIMTSSVASDEEIMRWLARNGIEYERLVHIKKQLEKLELDGDIFIDDNIDVAKGLAAKGKLVFLISQPWNRSADSGIGNVNVVKSWKEIEMALVPNAEFGSVLRKDRSKIALK